MLISLSEDVETNPGPKQNSTEKISLCNWNFDIISPHD